MAHKMQKYGEEVSAYKLLIISHIGGGKSQLTHLRDAITAARCSSGSSRRLSLCVLRPIALCLSRRFSFCLLLCALALLFVSCHPKATVCGVPYEGKTPWELAAAIHDDGDGTFAPVNVYDWTDKAYIAGFLLPSETPAHIVCDLEDGQVVMAVVYTSTVDTKDSTIE